MHRQPLLTLLAAHQPVDLQETAMLVELLQFVQDHTACFERTLACGHVTGSAWITDQDRTHALLTHHAKLDRWLQPGGHCDGDPDVLRVATREAMEESGLTIVTPVTTSIFDVDIHEIPARGAEAAHYHYDVRFLFVADRAEPLRITPESKALAWVPLGEVATRNAEASVRRMVYKTMA